jgi:hypothetical protein
MKYFSKSSITNIALIVVVVTVLLSIEQISGFSVISKSSRFRNDNSKLNIKNNDYDGDVTASTVVTSRRDAILRTFITTMSLTVSTTSIVNALDMDAFVNAQVSR